MEDLGIGDAGQGAVCEGDALWLPDTVTHDGTPAYIRLRNGVRAIAFTPGCGPLPAFDMGGGGSWLCAILAGRFVLREGGCTRILVPGRLYVCRSSRESFEARRIGSEDRQRLAAFVYFPRDWCKGCPRGGECATGRYLFDGLAGAAPGPEHLVLDEGMSSSLRGLIALQDAPLADPLKLEAKILKLLAWARDGALCRCGEAGSVPRLRPEDIERMRRAAELIERRFDDPPTIPELSRLVAINECDLKRKFKRVHGLSIACYSRLKRLEAARHLLAHSDLNIAEIALEVGFSNPSQFATAFRRQFGANPAQFRRCPELRKTVS
jgi:AraC-like DNA-binding protein